MNHNKSVKDHIRDKLRYDDNTKSTIDPDGNN